MSALGGAALAILFFAPLAFIYGRTLAGRLQARARLSGRAVAAIALPKLVLPVLIGAALAFRVAGADPEPGGGSATLAFALNVAWLVGSAALVLFFVAIPFVLGRLFGVAAAIAGYFAEVSENPLSFGANGYKKGGDGGEGPAGDGAEDRT